MAKKLKAIAQELPEAIEKFNKIVTGNELLELDADVVDSLLEPLIPSKKYTVPMTKKVDHEKNIIDAYKKGGINAVGQYQRQVLDYYLSNTSADE